LALPYNWIQK